MNPTSPFSLAVAAIVLLSLLGGEPIDDHQLWWNFVARDPARIAAASETWRNGGFPDVPDDDERMPLPADAPR